MQTEQSKDWVAAVRAEVDRNLLGIDKVDLVLDEAGGVLAYGHTADPNVTFVATFPLPVLEWRRA